MKIADSKADKYMRRVENLIIFEDNGKEISQQAKDLAAEAGLQLISFGKVLNTGKLMDKNKMTKKEPTEDDVYMLSYTSGTTGGDPKGVKLSHKMSMAAGYAINIRMGNAPLNEEDSYISYLPASHVFE